MLSGIGYKTDIKIGVQLAVIVERQVLLYTRQISRPQIRV